MEDGSIGSYVQFGSKADIETTRELVRFVPIVLI
jgi:hypothetical protein